jgi:hypothetical protein
LLQANVRGGIVNGFGMKLLVDISADSQLADAIHVSGPRPITDPVQQMGDAFRFIESLRVGLSQTHRIRRMAVSPVFFMKAWTISQKFGLEA